LLFFFSSRRRHTRSKRDWSSDVCSSDLAVHSAGAGHPGGSLSLADYLTYLYMVEMNVNPRDAKNPDRDRFVLSKGHCSPALYGEIGRASCRERVWLWGGVGGVTKKRSER